MNNDNKLTRQETIAVINLIAAEIQIVRAMDVQFMPDAKARLDMLGNAGLKIAAQLGDESKENQNEQI